MFLGTAPDDVTERQQLFLAYAQDYEQLDIDPKLQWFVTLTIEREIEIQDSAVSDDPIQWINSTEALKLGRTCKRDSQNDFELLTLTYLTLLLATDCFEVSVFDDHVTFKCHGRDSFIAPPQT